jgi:hypothetical protein
MIGSFITKDSLEKAGKVNFFEGFRRVKLVCQSIIFILGIGVGIGTWGGPEKIISRYRFTPDGSQTPTCRVVYTDKDKYNPETDVVEKNHYEFPLEYSDKQIDSLVWFAVLKKNALTFLQIIGCALLVVAVLELVFRLLVWVLSGFNPKHP